MNKSPNHKPVKSLVLLAVISSFLSFALADNLQENKTKNQATEIKPVPAQEIAATDQNEEGPATPVINPEEETAEDKEFLNTSESADFEEIEVED